MRNRTVFTLALMFLSLVIFVAAVSAETPQDTAPNIATDNHTISLQYGDIDTRVGQGDTPEDLTIDAYGAGDLGYYLVQFEGLILPEWAAQLEGVGVEILGYVPNNAYIVRTGLNSESLGAFAHVQWVGVYQPAYRIAPALLESRTEAEPLIVTVMTFPGAAVDQLVAQLESWGGQVQASSETELGGSVQVEIGSEYLDDVAHYSGVKWIEPWVEPSLLDD